MSAFFFAYLDTLKVVLLICLVGAYGFAAIGLAAKRRVGIGNLVGLAMIFAAVTVYLTLLKMGVGQ